MTSLSQTLANFCSGEAKTVIVVTILRSVVVAVSDANVVSIVVIATTKSKRVKGSGDNDSLIKLTLNFPKNKKR